MKKMYMVTFLIIYSSEDLHMIIYSSQSAQNNANSVLCYMTEARFSLYELDVIGYVGTITDTRWKTGVFTHLKKRLKDHEEPELV